MSLTTYERADATILAARLEPEPPIATVARVLVNSSNAVVLNGNNINATLSAITDVVSTFTPTTGGTVTAGTTKANELVNLTPAGTLATLTFVFPSDTNSRIGQHLTVLSSQIVTALTVTSTDLTLNGVAVTALAASVPVTWVKTAASTWSRYDIPAVASGVTLTSPVIATGLTASGSTSNDFSASTGTFKTSSGANQLTGAVTVADATTPSITTAAGKTNTGYVQVNGKTSGAIKVLPADTSGYTVTVTNATQTTAGTTLTIPDFASVADTFVFTTLAQTLASKTLTSPVISTGLTASGSAANTFAGSTGAFATSTGAFTSGASSFTVTPAITPTGGVAAAGGFSVKPRGIHTGMAPAMVSTDGNNSTPVTTETYVSEIFVPANCTITGVALFNGSNVTGNVTVGLADSTGAPITAAKSASTAGSGTDAYQLIPFAVAYAAKGPATYYIQVQYDSGTARYNTLAVGTHATVAQTSQTYGTFASFTPPTTFVANIGNIASLY